MCAARSVAVVGGGWAGCAAAVELAQAGAKVTLFESARTLGGRARAVAIHGHLLDNGQHIMLGAYSETLRLMRATGIDTGAAFLTLPLQMRYPPGAGMDFIAPRWPAPLHLLGAMLKARGLSAADKLALARFSTTARWMDWVLYRDCSVTELLDRFDQTPRLVQLMWRPLCLAALNTPPERASAQVFLNVLRDSLGAKRRAACDMLLPRVDLTAAFPAAAALRLDEAGASVRTGATVQGIARYRDRWQVESSGASVGGNWTAWFDDVVLATSPSAAAQLLAPLAVAPGGATDAAAIAAAWQAAHAPEPQPEPPPALRTAIAQLQALEYAPITTCYLQYDPGLQLELPFYALIDDEAQGRWGQFVFDRGQLAHAHAGLLAVVVSAADGAAALEQDALAASLAAQLAQDFGRPELASPAWTRVITDKRATFACTPSLARPANDLGLPGLVLAGDYTAGDYPSTIEGAVRSGVAAARLLGQRRQSPHGDA
jgi:squalene-associated FAD-dependent desaturase